MDKGQIYSPIGILYHFIDPLIYWNIIHKCPKQFRQSDWTKCNHELTNGKDMANQTRMCQLFSTHVHLKQSEWQRLFWITLTLFFESVSCVLKIWILPFLFSSVLIARDHAKNWSLTCSKDRTTYFYSLNNVGIRD